MANYFSNETPSGTVDGVNNSFSTANNIDTIITVILDGAVYSGTITVTGTNTFTVEVADAPTVSITVSYFDAISGVNFTSGILVSDLKSAFARRKKDISDVSNETFFDWCNQVNYFLYNKIKGWNFNEFRGEAFFTVSSSPSTQALPSDFKDLSEHESQIFIRNTDGRDTNQTLTRTGFGSEDRGYYLDGNNFVK